ncbi:MAG: hydrogenase iron-sulfur subunit [Deltaproteobacteria bacterium]|nr:hydrogenase iron-sulfur subunit [Deltaproteobacteria bacterium]
MKAPELESVFLNRGPIPEERDFRRVLVLGGDLAGATLRDRLISEGFEVVELGDEICAPASTGDGVAPGRVLERIDGFVGGFNATLSSGNGVETARFGFVIAAQPARRSAKFLDYGLGQSERVISLSQLENALNVNGLLPEPRGEWFHAAFLCGLEGDADPATFKRVFDAIEQLRSVLRVQPYILTRHVKVAAAGMERRYREIREAGALFFKFDDSRPVFEQGSGGLVIAFADPILGVELELAPDLVVVDERLAPPDSLKPLLDMIPSSAVTTPFLQPESSRFSGVRTPKAGILAAGASRGNFSLGSDAADVEAVVVALKTSTNQEIPAGLFGPPIVDPAKCTICLTCVRLCPHGAMSFRKRAEADPVSCMRCGICASECPMEAIRLEPAEGQEEVVGKIGVALSCTPNTERIVALLCSRSAAHAMATAGPRLSTNVIPIVVPCAGAVDISVVLKAFELGADGVLVAGCHTGNCASIWGTALAAGRISHAAAMLEEAAIDPRRVMFVSLASNTPGAFVRAVQELSDRTAKPEHMRL